MWDRRIAEWWPTVRDMACWGLGARWGDHLMHSQGPADPWKVQLVWVCLGLPLALRADARRRRRRATSNDGSDGSLPACNGQ